MRSKLKLIVSRIFLLIALFFTINLFFYLKQPAMVFYPVKEVDVTPDEWGLVYETVKLKFSGNKKLSGWYLPHPEAEKTLLFFHGNAGNISHRGDSIYIFHKLKLNVFIIDYPGYGDSEGQPSERSLYQSANLAWKYLTNIKKQSPENIIIFGRSLGGAIATDLALHVNAAGLILESTFSSASDLVDLVFPKWTSIFYLRYSFDSLNKIKKIKTPLLLIHSPDDQVIPYNLGVKLYNNATSEKVFLKIKGSHNDGFMQSISIYMKYLHSFIQSI